MSGKIPLVLFSGGADSTAVLQYRLKFSNCDILIANPHLQKLKVQAEALARKRILKHLHARSDYRVLKTYDLSESLQLPTFEHMGFRQMPSWIFAALATLDPERHSVVDVGYVLGDDASVAVEDLYTFWDLALKIFFPRIWDDQLSTWKPYRIPLSFPFAYSHKSTVYKQLGVELLGLTWSCETPVRANRKPVACGICKPCLTRAATIHSMNLPEKVPTLKKARKSKKAQ